MVTPTHRRPTPMDVRFSPSAATLEVLSSRIELLRGRVVHLDGPRVLVGRDAEADVCLADSRLSRRHAELRRDGDTVVLVDLSSTNGSWVNGERCVRRKLHHGDSVRLGATVFLFTSPEAGETPRVAAVKQELDAAGRCVDENFRQLEASFSDGRLTVDALDELLRECRHAFTRVLEQARCEGAPRPPGDATPVVARNPGAGRS